MNSFSPLLGILVIQYMAFLFGNSVGRTVQDEVVPARKYLTFLQDVLLLIMTALFMTAFGWGWKTVIAIVLLIAARILVPFSSAYAPVSGAILGATVFFQDALIPIAILALMLSYIAGTTVKQPGSVWIPQPVAAAVAFVLISYGPQMITGAL